MSDWNDKIITEFRENDGKVGGPFEGGTLALVTTTGAKSGEKRTAPLAARRDGDDVLVVASAAGAHQHPAWFHNIVADSAVHVEVRTEDGIEEFDGAARPIEDRAERDAAYAKFVAVMPGFADYERKTDRLIPVVRISRA